MLRSAVQGFWFVYDYIYVLTSLVQLAAFMTAVAIIYYAQPDSAVPQTSALHRYAYTDPALQCKGVLPAFAIIMQNQ